MKSLFSKLHVAIAVLSFATLGHAYGDNLPVYGQYNNCCESPSAGCGNGFISGEALYWRAFESGLDVCVPSCHSDKINSEGEVTSRFSGKSREPHYKWNPGYRVAAGYGFACSNLGVGAVWTHFQSNSNKSKHHGNELSWKFKLDVIDAVLAYDYEIGSCFNLRPYLGVRAARIDQNLHNHNVSGHCSSSDFFAFRTKNKQEFSGVGPLLGLGADWDIGCGFSFYANASVAWMYGRYNLRLAQFNDTFDTFNACHIKKHLDANLASADAALGIRWKTDICSMKLVLQLGLEHHRYFDFNRLGDCGDLSFDGVNLGAAIAF